MDGRNPPRPLPDRAGMTLAAFTPLPDGTVRLRVYRLTPEQAYLCHDACQPLEEALRELREILRPPPPAPWLTSAE